MSKPAYTIVINLVDGETENRCQLYKSGFTRSVVTTGELAAILKYEVENDTVIEPNEHLEIRIDENV